MKSASQQELGSHLQRLMFKRYLMGLGSYTLMAIVCWFAVFTGLFTGSMTTAAWMTIAMVCSQLPFLWLFLSGRNLRLADPSLTEVQVLLALAWESFTLAYFDSARGVMMSFYVMILLFGVFHLQPKVFARCALFALASFALMVTVEAYQQDVALSSMTWLQMSVLAIVLSWLCMFCGYVQVQRGHMRKRRYALQAHQDTLRGMMRQLENLASTDELTGLYNRRHFLTIATKALENLSDGRRHGLALIDLDHFKSINDHHGHAAGDRVLQAFAEVARSCLRDNDVIARYGGEEFVMLICNTDAEQFHACCERLRNAYTKAQPQDVAIDSLSLSIGMTLLHAGENLDQALHRADEALYQAKRRGRNRCEHTWATVGA